MFKKLLPEGKGTKPLADAVRACRWHFAMAAAFSAMVNLLYLTPTIYMMQIYDRVVPTGGLMTLIMITIVVVFALGCLALLDGLRTRLMVRAGLRLDRVLASTVLTRAISLQDNSGRSIQALREFDNTRGALAGPGVMALFDTPWTLIYLLFAFFLHPALGFLTLVGALLLCGLAALNERDSRPQLREAISAQNRAYAAQESIAAHFDVVRALGMRRSMTSRQLDERETATSANAHAQFTGGRYNGAIKFVRLALQSCALGLGALLTIEGHISAGSIIAASILLSRAVAPIEQIVGAWPSLVQGRASWANLVNLFERTSGVDVERTMLPPPSGDLVLEGVSVRYNDGDSPQLKNISFKLDPGQVLGVVGSSGSGKTTLARVIAGAQKCGLGKVRLDGADYESWDGDQLARYIGYLPQGTVLFAGTIKDNISRFAVAGGEDPVAVDFAAVTAAKAAGAHDVIQKLPGGYDALLGPNGAGLSAGQAQRIGLARALYGAPKLIVLDEPNSALDQDGESALMTAMTNAAGWGATIVVFAHRAGVLARVDRLMVMRDGANALIGPREEVLGQLRQNRSALDVTSAQ
ncbi:type I secretion system permease/ATPase [Brevundimonas intermedia]|uniref:Type I secretion system permease/ATPase n=1 Tax=Brevundimonas intermedia TaxID=74315 RepID=A0A4Y9RZ72_9CAUL|nr:type I secretion system permease/ATPase [Brevundimonas intermedia]TFW14354.1 type I secretion system permease/ATPase [Brevundimonas intermedia]